MQIDLFDNGYKKVYTGGLHTVWCNGESHYARYHIPIIKNYEMVWIDGSMIDEPYLCDCANYK